MPIFKISNNTVDITSHARIERCGIPEKRVEVPFGTSTFFCIIKYPSPNSCKEKGIIFYHSIFLFFQTEGEKRISIGKISNLPNNIAKDRTIFAKYE